MEKTEITLSYAERENKLWSKMKSRGVRRFHSSERTLINSKKQLWLIVFTKDLNVESEWYTKFWIWDSYQHKIIGENHMKFGVRYIKVDWNYKTIFMSHGTGIFMYDFEGKHRFIFPECYGEFYHRFMSENELFMIGYNQQAFIFDLKAERLLKDKPYNIDETNYRMCLDPSIIFRCWKFAISDWTEIHRDKKCFVFVGAKIVNSLLGKTIVYKCESHSEKYYKLCWQSETRKDMSPEDSIVLFDDTSITIQNKFKGTDLFFEQKLPIGLL